MRGFVLFLVACHGAGDTTDTNNPNDTTDTDVTDTSDTDVTGDGPHIAGCPVFPADNPWNTPITDLPVRSDSDGFINDIGSTRGLHPDFGTVYNNAPIGIPYATVPGDQARVLIAFGYLDESDPGPYPIPPDVPIEGGTYGASNDGDRHVVVVDRDNCELYEMFNAWPQTDGSWTAGSGAVWNLRSNAGRTPGWTSADAAGLPILPGLVRYDEVMIDHVVKHAVRFTVQHSMRGYIAPASHYAAHCDPADCPTQAPMGLRVRMKADFDCSGLSDEVQVLCTAFKTYGMIVADNGSNWFISGAPDARWDDDHLHDLSQIPGSAFEVVNTGPIVGP